MGYTTDYYGTIKLSKKGAKVLESHYKDIEDLEEEFDMYGIIFGEGELEISGEGRLYDNELEKFCLFIAILDDKCSGELICFGDDRDDMWRIIIGKGKIIIERGYIEYEKGEEFKDTKTKKKVYKITKDKRLLKEVLVESLE